MYILQLYIKRKFDSQGLIVDKRSGSGSATLVKGVQVDI